MLIANRQNTPFGQYEGFKTHLLSGEGNSGSREISIQITDVEPDGMQFLHSHEQAQCYYIVSGVGRITIDGVSEDVTSGDAVFIPSNAVHGIENTGQLTLVYVTANQAFGETREKELWPD